MVKKILATLTAIALIGCSDKQPKGTSAGFAEEIELERGKFYHLKFSDTEYEFSVDDEGFSIMRIDGSDEDVWSPFTAILRDGKLYYEFRTTDGSNLYYVRDTDGDGLADERLTYPKKVLPGTSARIERITHEFIVERPLILPPAKAEGSGQQPPTSPDSKRYESVGNNNGRIMFAGQDEFLDETFEEVFRPLLLSEKVRGFLPLNIHISGDGNVLSSLGCTSLDPEYDKSILRKIDSIKLDPPPNGREYRFSIFLVPNGSWVDFK